MTRSCSFPGCHLEYLAKGYCSPHYVQLRRGGALKPIDPKHQLNRKPCDFDGCSRAHYARGYCQRHYRQQRRGVALKPINPNYHPGVKSCGFEGCDRAHYGRGYCRPHYAQLRRGVELSPIQKQRPKGVSLIRDENGNKKCSRCKIWLPESDFSQSTSSADRLVHRCRACQSAYMRSWKYGLDESVLVGMIQAQGGQCLACDADLSDGYCVDHDHSCCPGNNAPTCGKCVRGLLCDTCNKLLGQLEVNVDRTRRLLEYSGVEFCE